MSDNSQNGMRREFANRDALVAYLKEQFPEAAAVDDHVAARRGGRQAAEAVLAKIDPRAYGKTRNFLDGDVTYLSAYIRYGVLSLAEVRDAALGKSSRSNAEKLVQELGWRDYFQRAYAEMGSGVWQDREPYKTGFDAAEYADDLPDDIRYGETGCCLDIFCRQLFETGYLHNHARMWLAAYVVHWRRVKWQAGASWFLEHLLDGDPASNNLSWQWVASTFSHKPYIFNRDNIEKYIGDASLLDPYPIESCPFADSYEGLNARLFPRKPSEAEAKQGRGGQGKPKPKSKSKRWHK